MSCELRQSSVSSRRQSTEFGFACSMTLRSASNLNSSLPRFTIVNGTRNVRNWTSGHLRHTYPIIVRSAGLAGKTEQDGSQCFLSRGKEERARQRQRKGERCCVHTHTHTHTHTHHVHERVRE